MTQVRAGAGVVVLVVVVAVSFCSFFPWHPLAEEIFQLEQLDDGISVALKSFSWPIWRVFSCEQRFFFSMKEFIQKWNYS